MDEKKRIKYIDTSKAVEITDIESVNQTAFFDMIAEAMKMATKEDIKANSIILNEKFAKVNPHLFNLFGAVGELPAMICGLECSMVSDELPDEYAFAILEKPKTEREWLIEKTKSDTAREILDEAKKWVKAHYKDKVTDSFGEREMLFMEAFGCLFEYLKEKYGVEVE